MKITNGLFFSKDHEWVRVEGEKAYIGITHYAQKKLGEIVFVELPELGLEVSKHDDFAVVESIKAASDIYAPVSGKVISINESLEEEPEALNKEPFENHIAVLLLDDDGELEGLMSAEEYEIFCSEE